MQRGLTEIPLGGKGGYLLERRAQAFRRASLVAQMPQGNRQGVVQGRLIIDRGERFDGAVGRFRLSRGGQMDAGLKRHGTPVLGIGAPRAAHKLQRPLMIPQRRHSLLRETA